jgi:hypothetical protein
MAQALAALAADPARAARMGQGGNASGSTSACWR